MPTHGNKTVRGFFTMELLPRIAPEAAFSSSNGGASRTSGHWATWISLIKVAISSAAGISRERAAAWPAHCAANS